MCYVTYMSILMNHLKSNIFLQYIRTNFELCNQLCDDVSYVK